MDLAKKTRGFSLIELLVVIAIIGLLSSFVITSLGSSKGKARYTQMVSDLERIAMAAHMSYEDLGVWAADVPDGVAPAFLPVYMASWPTPPCPGWRYDWDNWTNDPSKTVRITVVNPSSPQTRKFFLCLQTATDCEIGSDGSPYEVPIKNYSARTISCSE